MKKNLIISVFVVLSLFVSFPKHASGAIIPNGLTNNGLMNNGLQHNGFQRNGLTKNGLANNGLQKNGLKANGLLNNSSQANTLAPVVNEQPENDPSVSFRSNNVRAINGKLVKTSR